MDSVTNNLIEGIFDAGFLEQMAENAPTEGSGLNRDYPLCVENAYFALASADYEAKIDKSKARVGQNIFAILEGYDANIGPSEKRKEQFSVGQGWKLNGGDGKTSPSIIAAGSYTNISGNSLYGRMFRELTEGWGVSDEDRETGRWNLPAGVDKNGEPRFITLGPDGRRFFTHCTSKFKRPPTPAEITNFEGCTLQMSPEAWELDGKPRERTFPTALLSTSLEAGAFQPQGPRPSAPSSNQVQNNNSDFSEEELVIQLSLISQNVKDYSQFFAESSKKIKEMVPSTQQKKWISFVAQKKTYESYLKSEGRKPE